MPLPPSFEIAKHVDPSGVLVSEKVFGILLAALAVQPMLGGVADLIALAGH